MISVTLYKAGAFNETVQFPSEWNDLTKEEMLEICRQQLMIKQEPFAQKASLFHFILNGRISQQKIKLAKNWFDELNLEDAATFGLPLLDFIYTENTRTEAAEPVIKFIGSALFAPEKFSKITCGQFEDAEIFFQQFLKKPEAESLSKLASVFWLPKGQKYVTYNSRTTEYIKWPVDKYAKKFMKLQPWRLYSIFTWYSGNRAQLPKKFPDVYGSGSDNNTSSAPDLLAFTKCIHSGAGPKNGTRDQIRMSMLFEYLFEMNEEAKKAKELKELYESNSK